MPLFSLSGVRLGVQRGAPLYQVNAWACICTLRWAKCREMCSAMRYNPQNQSNIISRLPIFLQYFLTIQNALKPSIKSLQNHLENILKSQITTYKLKVPQFSDLTHNCPKLKFFLSVPSNSKSQKIQTIWRK